jgi:mono/diheme cytochrome c family protein
MLLRFLSRGTVLAVATFAAAACAHNSATTTMAGAPQPAAAKAPSLPEGVTPLMIATGDSIFHKASCVRCHGADAKGTARGANLTDSQWSQISGSYPEIVKVITDGVPADKIKLPGATRPMGARGGTNLTDDQIKQVAAYVYSISHS